MPICYTINWTLMLIGDIVLTVGGLIAGFILGYAVSQRRNKIKQKNKGQVKK